MLSSLAFTFQHVVETPAKPEALWRLYSDVSTWPRWDHAVEVVTLDGPFAEGTTGALKLHGRDPLPFRLTEVDHELGFVDETAIPGGLVRFRHRIAPLDGGRVRLTHAVEIEAPQPVAEELGALISAGVPETMAALATLAEGATP
jgi:Polyketide cyclase / dehydrase and lipid transport